MKIQPEEAEQLVADIRSSVSFFRQVDEKALNALVSQVLVETTGTLRDIEERVKDAGVVPGDIAAILMHYGAVAAVVEDLPPGAHQRQMVAAGREVGKFIAAKFGEKIREQLESTTKGKEH